MSVQALLKLARAYIALADPHGARAVLGQADDILQQRPDLGVLGQQADQLRVKSTPSAPTCWGVVADHGRAAPAALLPTHLSFREIGERLYLSPHTVKSQAISIYHKLGASSRSQAVQRTQQLGLLTG